MEFTSTRVYLWTMGEANGISAELNDDKKWLSRLRLYLTETPEVGDCYPWLSQFQPISQKLLQPLTAVQAKELDGTVNAIWEASRDFGKWAVCESHCGFTMMLHIYLNFRKRSNPYRSQLVNIIFSHRPNTFVFESTGSVSWLVFLM